MVAMRVVVVMMMMMMMAIIMITIIIMVCAVLVIWFVWCVCVCCMATRSRPIISGIYDEPLCKNTFVSRPSHASLTPHAPTHAFS